MNWLRDELASRFELEAAKYLKDPWAARNSFIEVVFDRSRESTERFFSEHASRELGDEDKRRVLKLLEMQRHAMLMFTSCGWFFDEVSGIETVQVMMYASRAMQLAKQVYGSDFEPQFKNILQAAPSNIPEFGNGAKVYDRFINRARADLARIAAQSTILQLFSTENSELTTAQEYGCCFKITNHALERHEAGKFLLVLSHFTVQSAITLDEARFACAGVWLGDHNVSCGVKADADEPTFQAISKDLLDSFGKGQINEVILLMPKHFGENNYSLKDVFEDDQIRILNLILQEALKKATDLNEIIYHDNSALLRFMNEAGLTPPRPFRQAAEIVLNSEIMKLLTADELQVENLAKLIAEAKALPVEFDVNRLSLEASNRITNEFAKLSETPSDVQQLNSLNSFIAALRQLPVKLDLWHAQNSAYKIAQNLYKPMKEKTDAASQEWAKTFESLCLSIGIRLD